MFDPRSFIVPDQPRSDGSGTDKASAPAPQRGPSKGLFKPWLHSGGDRPCVCGHEAAAHMHFRRGDDCGICGAALCARYRRMT
jgi:hypothetical protein